MAEAEQVETPVSPPARRRPSALILGLSAALVLISCVCAYALLALHKAQAAPSVGAASHSGASHEATAPAPASVELYLPVEPALVVNFHDDESIRYLQVGITLMSHEVNAINVAKDADPVIRDALIGLFSNSDYAAASSAAGRDKLQAQALLAVRKIVQARLGRPGIDALYFTSFVMQ